MRTITYVPLDQLQPADNNPKIHDIDLIARMISTHGYITPGVIDARTGKLVAGHGRREALLQLRDTYAPVPRGIRVDPDTGDWLVPTVTGWASDSDDMAVSVLVGDNQATLVGAWSDADLSELLHSIGDADLVGVTGIDLEELDRMILGVGEDDEEEEPPAPLTGTQTIKIEATRDLIEQWNTRLADYLDTDNPPAALLAELLSS